MGAQVVRLEETPKRLIKAGDKLSFDEGFKFSAFVRNGLNAGKFSNPQPDTFFQELYAERKALVIAEEDRILAYDIPKNKASGSEPDYVTTVFLDASDRPDFTLPILRVRADATRFTLRRDPIEQSILHLSAGGSYLHYYKDGRVQDVPAILEKIRRRAISRGLNAEARIKIKFAKFEASLRKELEISHVAAGYTGGLSSAPSIAAMSQDDTTRPLQDRATARNWLGRLTL